MTPLQRIKLAQDFFRFAHLVGSPISFGLEVDFPDPPEIHIWGRHSLGRKDLQLDEDRFGLCGTILERLAYRLLAMELDAVLSKEFSGDRFNRKEDFVRNASTIVRLIRNTVAHNILEPIWKIDRKFQNRKIVIDGILAFDATGLNGKHLKRLDFGGPIAPFRLSERVVNYLTTSPSPSPAA